MDHSHRLADMGTCRGAEVHRLVGSRMEDHDLDNLYRLHEDHEDHKCRDDPSHKLEIDQLEVDHMVLVQVGCFVVLSTPLARLGLACLECLALEWPRQLVLE